jgi:hypothetical protein
VLTGGASTRPFLTAIEKKWISYQLLHAMRDARQRKVSAHSWSIPRTC